MKEKRTRKNFMFTDSDLENLKKATKKLGLLSEAETIRFVLKKLADFEETKSEGNSK